TASLAAGGEDGARDAADLRRGIARVVGRRARRLPAAHPQEFAARELAALLDVPQVGNQRARARVFLRERLTREKRVDARVGQAPDGHSDGVGFADQTAAMATISTRYLALAS